MNDRLSEQDKSRLYQLARHKIATDIPNSLEVSTIRMLFDSFIAPFDNVMRALPAATVEHYAHIRNPGEMGEMQIFREELSRRQIDEAQNRTLAQQEA